VDRLQRELGEAKKPVSRCDREMQEKRRKVAEFTSEIKRLEKMIQQAKEENSKSTGSEVCV
jgi:peptidoglycan hydrolase CwlO-like protein